MFPLFGMGPRELIAGGRVRGVGNCTPASRRG